MITLLKIWYSKPRGVDEHPIEKRGYIPSRIIPLKIIQFEALYEKVRNFIHSKKMTG